MSHPTNEKVAEFKQEVEEGAYRYTCGLPECGHERVWGNKFCQEHWDHEDDFSGATKGDR